MYMGVLYEYELTGYTKYETSSPFTVPSNSQVIITVWRSDGYDIK